MKKKDLNFSKDYLDDVMIRFTYHSNAIEGNTLTLANTTSILLYGSVAGSDNFELRELYEVDNHKRAFQEMLQYLDENEEVSVSMILKFHEKLTENTIYDNGKFRTSDNEITGASFQTPPYQQVPMLIKQWCDNTLYLLENEPNKEKKLEIILRQHIEFEKIHPFSDGNGRTGRILMNYLALQNDFPFLVIEKNDRARYINFLSEETVKEFSLYALEKMKAERERRDNFFTIEKMKIKK